MPSDQRQTTWTQATNWLTGTGAICAAVVPVVDILAPPRGHVVGVLGQGGHWEFTPGRVLGLLETPAFAGALILCPLAVLAGLVALVMERRFKPLGLALVVLTVGLGIDAVFMVLARSAGM